MTLWINNHNKTIVDNINKHLLILLIILTINNNNNKMEVKWCRINNKWVNNKYSNVTTVKESNE